MQTLRAWSVLVGATLATAWTPAADAAYFDSQPSPYARSGAGPFRWLPRSSDPGGPNGSVAYRLSTEAAWHRCGVDGPPPVLANLPEGRYGISVADDVDRSLLPPGSPSALPCLDALGAAPLTPIIESSFVVDLTAPEVSEPVASVDGLTVGLSISASDALSGIASIAWRFDDGVVMRDAQSARRTFATAGVQGVTVEATDRAGNASSRRMGFFLPGIASPAGRALTPAAAVPDRTPPTVLRSGAATRSLGTRRSVGVVVFCGEPCELAARGALRIGSRRIALRATTPRRASTRVPTTLRLKLTSRARATVLRALRSGRKVRATILVTATDPAGNVTRRRLVTRLRRESR